MDPKKVSYTMRFKRSVVRHAFDTGSKSKTSKHFNVPRSNVIRWCQSAGSVLIKNKRINRETRRVNKLSDEARQKSARNQ